MKYSLINSFAGSYLNEGANIGHEVINLFKDDNGQNYLYITPGGKVDSSHSVKSVIFVRNIEGKTTVEVIAKAEKLCPIDVAPNDVKYADTPISNVLVITYTMVSLILAYFLHTELIRLGYLEKILEYY